MYIYYYIRRVNVSEKGESSNEENETCMGNFF